MLGVTLIPAFGQSNMDGGVEFAKGFSQAALAWFPVVWIAFAVLPGGMFRGFLPNAPRVAGTSVDRGILALRPVLLLLPLFAFAAPLRRARRAAVPAYASLVGDQGRLVHRRWIERKAIDDDEVLEPAGVGAVADASVLYDAVKKMRAVPVGKAALAGILVPLAIPFLLLATVQIPLKDMLLKLLKVLV